MASRFDRIASELVSAATRGRRVVAVAGCHREEGATSVLQCIARSLTGLSAAALLVDTDLQDPQLARRLGILPEAGWDDVLAGQLQLPDVLIHSIEDRLVLLPMRKAMAVRQIGSGEVQQAVIVGLLRDHYEIVLIDTGPILDTQTNGLEALAEAGVIDAAVIVRNRAVTERADLDEAVVRLDSYKIACAGVIENFDRSSLAQVPDRAAA